MKLDKTDTTGLNTIVQGWIKQSESLIISYTHNDFSSGVSDAVKNVCLRLTSNMVALSVARRDTPITQPNDWTVQILSSEIFTDDLKEDLEPFVFVFTVTGEDL